MSKVKNDNHPQLDPCLNRTRVPPAVMEEVPEFPPVDPENPYVNTYLGQIDVSFQDTKGIKRPALLYIPKTEKSAWNMVLVFVPGGKEPSQFIQEGNWEETLERHCMTALFLGAPAGWQQDEPGFELETAVKALAILRENRYFQSNAPAIYCMGFEDGAWLASLFAVTHTSVLAAWAAMGDTGLPQELLDQLGDGPSDCDVGKMRRELPLPTFLMDEKESNILHYFKAAGRVAEEGLENPYGKVYRQQAGLMDSFRNDTVCTEVWYGTLEKVAQLGLPTIVQAMVSFVERFKRWGGEGNGHIRRTMYPVEEGMKRTDVVVDGRKRYWLTYEPSAYRRGEKETYPLVIAIHGFTCSGEFFANNTGWHWVGEERGALIVYPSAYPRTRDKESVMGAHIATPEWNAGGFPGSPDPQGPDELNYFRELLKRTLETYPIDKSRIYVTGHSNGAMMTQRLMRYMPEVFAGFAPVGFMENLRGTMEPEPDDGILRNVWYTVGEFDGKGCVLEEGNVNVSTIRLLCQHNKVIYENRRYYETGIYMHSIFRNEEGVPLIRFTGIKNWPHTYSPELAFMIYDEFFARFVRHEDGTLEYLA